MKLRTMALLGVLAMPGAVVAQTNLAADRDLVRLLNEAANRLQAFVDREEARVAGVTLASAEHFLRCRGVDQDATNWIITRTRLRIASAGADLRRLAEEVAGDTTRSLRAGSAENACTSAGHAVRSAALAEIGDALRSSRR